MFKDKILLITGGYRFFWKCSMFKISKFRKSKEIRILSRDEKNKKICVNSITMINSKFYIGDVRDYNSIEGAFIGVDYVFHAAALKQVPSCVLSY